MPRPRRQTPLPPPPAIDGDTPRHPHVQTPPPIDEAPKCCTQRTITIPGDVDAKSRQRHYWGSPTWIKAFSRRSRVEGWFGNLKNHSTEALRRGTFRVIGICKTSIMLTIYAAATNLRLLRAWARRQHGSEDLLAWLMPQPVVPSPPLKRPQHSSADPPN